MRVRRAASLLLVLALAGIGAPREAMRREREESESGGPYPSDWFGAQRAFPGTSIPQERFAAALQQDRLERVLQALKPNATAALTWVQAGPFNIGGRLTALAVAPGGGTLFAGSANGGVFESFDAGAHWTPVSDDLAVYSIGALALQPGNPNVVYLGTGESNSSIDSYDGAGLFRSSDGGATWQYLGLQATRRIARVAIDPQDPNRIFVAAMGAQFSTGPDRGLYRSEDGGQSWNRMLFVNDSTGVADVVIHPTHPDTVFAATWERIRRPSYRRTYGRGGGIWRSIDRGTTWTRLTTGLPAANDSLGRIALAIAPSRPRTIYAQIGSGANLKHIGLGMYRSTDGGDSWSRRDIGTAFTSMFGRFCWYFGDTAVDPSNPDIVYALGVTLQRSTDGGVNFTNITNNAHVDMHALWIDPANGSHLYLGSDGGFFSTSTGGTSWFKSVDMPITQFYAGTIDAQYPQRILGGTQDNGTIMTRGSPDAWFEILGGDGFHGLVGPTDSSLVFAEWQNGSSGSGPQRSTDGGASFVAPTGFSGSDRYNWNAPFVMAPADPSVLLAGSQRVYRSTDNGQNYFPISPDLTTNPPASLVYGTITTLAISPLSSSVYYAGTDDGKVWRSGDAGAHWNDVSAGLPKRWVTRVAADPFDVQSVYVTLSGFSIDENAAHVYRSRDAGATWIPVDANLPDVPVDDIVPDPSDRYTLFVANDLGVYATRNGGASWFPLGSGMPVQTVHDLTLHAPSRTLVAATHGRSQWKIDLAALPVAVGPAPAAGLRLSQPVPNPSRAAARFALDLPAASAVEVAVYDAAGHRLRLLRAGSLAAGRHPLVWDGRDAAGRRAAAGVYFVRAAAGGAVHVQRLVRLD